MGSSKKHKDRDRKKHRRRSRSRSRERERRHKRRHYYDDEVEVPEKKEEIRIKTEPVNDEDEENISEGGTKLSLGISDTNKLRAKLGLKPLEINEEVQIPGLGDENSNVSAPESGKQEVFVKTENISKKEEAEKLKDKLTTLKEKRIITSKLSKIKGLAESDSEEETAAKWVAKSRKLQEEKELADKRAKLLEEMDEEFGVGALIEEEFNMKKKTEKNYSSKDLKGLVVGHAREQFEEGENVILTLKDKGVLEESDDVLENVNFIDSEKAAKNIENKLRKNDYKPYDDEYDEFGMVKKKNLLSKYDEEIEGVKKETFVIGSSGVDREKQLELIRMKLKQQQEVTLDLPVLKIANEYYTTEEMVRFKKPKKKVRKVRKRELLKPEDLIPLPGEGAGVDHGSRKSSKTITSKQSNNVTNEKEEELSGNASSEVIDMEIDKNDLDEPEILGPDEDLTGVPVEEDKAELELQIALTKARKLKQKEILSSRSEKVAEAIKKSEENQSIVTSPNQNKIGSIVLNSTAEFCRTLGEIPTYGMSGNRDEEAEELMNICTSELFYENIGDSGMQEKFIKDYEKELIEEKRRLDQEAQNRGAWNEVDIEEKPVEIKNRENEPILEEEPDVSVGLAGALVLAMKKGYLEQESKKMSSAPRPSQLQAQTYTIEEKFYEDDKFGKRDRYTGPIQDFKEKDTYKPDVKLEYIDDSGRILTAKEAFRYLSHKFHGKGPGKNKVDKRMKKLDQDARLKQMSSTDTPLNTLKMLQEKQKELQTPYIVLSGGNKTLTQTSLAKPK